MRSSSTYGGFPRSRRSPCTPSVTRAKPRCCQQRVTAWATSRKRSPMFIFSPTIMTRSFFVPREGQAECDDWDANGYQGQSRVLRHEPLPTEDPDRGPFLAVVTLLP